MNMREVDAGFEQVAFHRGWMVPRRGLEGERPERDTEWTREHDKELT